MLSSFTPQNLLLADTPIPKNAPPNDLSLTMARLTRLEGTLPQFHTHPSDAYEIATLFLFSSFLYRRINSAPFSMRHRNTTHPPPTTRGQKKALALYFMYQIRKKKWSFSTPLFSGRPVSGVQNPIQIRLMHRLKCGNHRPCLRVIRAVCAYGERNSVAQMVAAGFTE